MHDYGYNRQALIEIIGAEAVNLIDSLLESRLIVKSHMKDGESVVVNGSTMNLVCKVKAQEIGTAIADFIETQNTYFI